MEKKLRIARSTSGEMPTEELFEKYAKSGIEAMEISTDNSKCDRIDYKATEKYAKNAGVELWSYHLPFWATEYKIDIASPDRDERRKTIERETELIGRAADIGIAKFIIHPCLERAEETNRAERIETAKDSLALLADAARKEGATICVEDLPRTCLGRTAEEIKELISADPDLRVCFDTNHLLTESVVSFARALGDKIVTLHVSDYDNINERHWLPGEGIINWHELYDTLLDVGYNGPWLYELGFGCPKTIQRDRDLTCEDFVRNANEIFEHRKLTVISKPIPNLGMWH